MRIIFVGIHNKPGMLPLDSRTRTGKIVSRIIELLPGHQVLRTNLIDLDEMPAEEQAKQQAYEWLYTYVPEAKDIIVQLGGDVQILFPKHVPGHLIAVSHPAAHRSNAKQLDYIQKVAEKIQKIIHNN